MSALSSSQILDDYILNTLDRLNIGSVKKRIINELVEFKKKDANIHVELEENYKEFNKVTIKVTVVLNQENDIYSFHISRDYPFKPPSKFIINYKDYKQYLKIDSPKTIQELRTCNHIKCLCCSTILCSASWSPILKMENIIIEFKQIKKYRRDIINRLLAKKITGKYLNSDLNYILNEWLGLS